MLREEMRYLWNRLHYYEFRFARGKRVLWQWTNGRK